MSITDRLRELEQAATPAPWWVDDPGEIGGNYGFAIGIIAAPGSVVVVEDTLTGVRDAALIVALRNAAPELLRVVEAARYFRAEQESGDVNPDPAEALWQDLCAALDALEEKE